MFSERGSACFECFFDVLDFLVGFAFLVCFAFWVLLDFLDDLVLFEVAGLAVGATAAGTAELEGASGTADGTVDGTGSAAQTMLAKEMATRAATDVDKIFFTGILLGLFMR